MLSDIISLEDIQQFDLIIRVLIATLVILIGWLISCGIGQIISSLLNKIRLNRLLKRMGWDEAFEKADIRLNASKFFGEIIKWVFILIFLLLSSDIVGLAAFSGYVEKILDYFRHIIVACLIFIVAVFLSDFSQKIIVASAQKAKIVYSRLLGLGVRWAVWIFAIFAILSELQVASTVVTAMIYGLVAASSISFGLAFGLGGKELAAEILKEFKNKIS